MNPGAPYRVIDGIKCFHPEVAEEYSSYPSAGFDVTDDLEADSFWVQSRIRILKQEVHRATADLAKVRLLEIGCGTGAFLQALSSDSRYQLTGSEIYLRGLQSARARTSDIEFIQIDATGIPFENEFDVIGAFDVIEHIKDDRSVLYGICRALKSGGHLVITVPQHQFLWSRLDELVHHQRRYARRDLVSKLQGAGLQIQFISSFVFTLFPLMLISRLLDKRKSNNGSDSEFDQRVRFSPLVNKTLGALMHADEVMLRWRWSLPFGGSLLAVARKP